MNKKTLRALKKSIKHWEENVAAENVTQASITAQSCALCDEFIRYECEGCPISAKVKYDLCRNTPYQDAKHAWFCWSDDQHTGNENNEKLCAQFRMHAEKELKFLKSLLPIGEA